MGGADRDRRDDALGAAGQGVLGAAQVGGEHGDDQVGIGQGVGDHCGSVGHLRQQLGRHEGGDLHVADAGGIGRVDPFQLVGSGHGALQALQTVTHAHFVDRYSCHWLVLESWLTWVKTREPPLQGKDVFGGLIHRQPRWMGDGPRAWLARPAAAPAGD
ncbi:hypothetical protein D3C78_1300410 [compost metagenome]